MPQNIETQKYNFNPENIKPENQVSILRPVAVDLYFSDLDEAKERRELSAKIGKIFESIPNVNMEVDEAVNKKLIEQDQLINTYNSLSNFIQKDPNHSRLILYLPFQLLPNLNINPQSEKLVESQVKFAEVYKDAWIRLLFESDIRADFVDGDILEPGLGEPPRVRKVAHLIPEILNRGIITKEDLDLILEINSSDKELCRSIMEGLDTNTLVEESGDFNLNDLKSKLSEIEKKYGQNSEYISGLSLKEKYDSHNQIDSKISKERASWIKRTKREEIFNEYTKKIHDLNTIKSLLKFDDPDPAYKIIGLKAIFNQNKQTEVFEELIKKHWQTGTNQIKGVIITGLSYWYKNGMISPEYIEQFGVKIPDLYKPFSVDLDNLISFELKNIVQAAKKIKECPILAENIYPVLLVFGSRVKGYADFDSDYDMAVFFKPNTSIDNRVITLESIRALFELKDIGKICEFWTNEKNGKIGFRPISEKIWGMVGPEQIHFLFGGVWMGDQIETNKIRQDLSEKYFNLSRLGQQKDLVRSRLLNNLESDILQCRLMHKGYRKFYPDKIDLKIKKMESIDGNSTFWDPGFRRVATQLFLSRVFLPDLSRK